MTYTLDWSETDLGGTAVVSYGSGAILDFTDKPSGATSALSITSNQSDGVDNILAEFSIVTTGSSVMTFDYKVSTESGWDKFHIDVDGVSQANYSGIVAWTSHTGINIASAGTHTIRFRYTKDSGGAGNADRVWVALLNITNTTTVNDAAGTVDTYDMEDGAIPSFVTTSTWTNSTSAPITGSRSLRSPASPANSGTYDLEIEKAAGSDWAAVGFDFKVSTEAGWDKLFLFPDATATNVPATGSPSTAGESGWLDWSGTTSGRIAVILPAATSSLLLRYTKDGGGAGGSDAVWIDNLDMPAAGGGGTTVNGTAGAAYGYTATASGVPRTPGTAASTWTLTATANGIDRARGQAVATLSFTGTAAGIDRARGTASATIGWTGAASGTARTRGAAAATWGLTATAAGEVTILATAAATYTFTGTASGGVGDQPAEGTATSSIGFTGTASGLPRVVAASVTTYAWSGTAAGVDRSIGTAAATIAWTATAAGVDGALGVAVGTYAFTGTVVGDGTTPAVEGTASATIGWAATATGRRRVIAAIATTYALTATARGVNLSIVTPAERTTVIAAETRVLVIPTEARVTTIPPENRTLEA